MKRSESSKRWLKEHFADAYVKRAKQEGYRSRSAYKLIEINEKDKLFRPGMVVIDLGASPGGWSQLLSNWTQPKGRVIAIDLLLMQPLPHVEFIQGDFQEPDIFEKLLQCLNKAPVDVVVSDMAPNISGMKTVDQPRSMYLAELALNFAQQVLKSEGCFLVKIFEGEGSDQYLRTLRQCFKKVIIRKPSSSRNRSSEIYLLAKGFNVSYRVY